MNLRTDFLYARPSWLSGLARVLDLFGVFDSYNESRNPREADARAMYSDWRIVGQDIAWCVHRFDSEQAASDQAAKDKQLPLFAAH